MDADEAARLLGWEVVPDGWGFIEIHRGGMLSAFVLIKGNEIHVHRLSAFKGRWLTRQDVERICLPLIAEYGEIRTTVLSKNDVGHAFVQRLGFTRTHESRGVVHYRTERLKHARL